MLVSVVTGPFILPPVMGFGKSVWVLPWFFVLSCGFAVTPENPTYRCKRANLILSSTYRRSTNRSTTNLYTDFTTFLVTLEDHRLVSQFSWVNISGTEPERKLAVSQVEKLGELASKFSCNDSFFLEVQIAGMTGLVTMHVDSSFAVADVGSTTVEFKEGIDADTILSYANSRNLTTFLASSAAILPKWRETCEKAVQLDTIDSVNVTLLYHSNTSTFQCTLVSRAPVPHDISFRCAGLGGSTIEEEAVTGGEKCRENAFWSESRCNVSSVECIVTSQRGWQIVKRVRTDEDFSAITTRPEDLFTAASSHTSNSVASVTISIVVILCALGFLIFAWCKYKSAVRPLNDLGRLMRQGMERLHVNGYARTSPC